jgi:ABC-type multidrug transport system fused ATPase/permease subunit
MRLLANLIWPHIKRHPWLSVCTYGFALVIAALWVIEPLYSSYAVDKLLSIQTGAQVDLWRIALYWGAIFVALSISQAIGKYAQWWFDMSLELETVENAYQHILRLPISFHNTQKTGEAMKTIQDGGDQLAYMINRNILQLGMSLGAAVTFLVVSFLIEWRLALILIGVLLIFMTLVIIGTLKTRKLQDEANQLWVKPSGRQFDAITNISSVKSGAQEDREFSTVVRLDGEGLAMQLRINKLWAFLEAMHFFMLTRILLVAVGVLLMVRGKLTLGELYFFQFSFYRVLTPFEMLADVLPQWRKAYGKVTMMHTLLGADVEAGARKPGIVPTELKGEIRFEDVCFAYVEKPAAAAEHDAKSPHRPEPINEVADETGLAGRDESRGVDAPETTDAKNETAEWRATLRNLTFTIKPGEHVALVGHSGAGKSTVASLLNRFYDVTGGRILVDGIDMNDLDVGWWRSQIGLVLQENLMFNDTVLENIRYARPSATLEEAKLAAKRASADEFIERLPKKYDSEIGERGVKLSGGERQRLAIARAILKDPKIVILDEATSALDSMTERKVQKGIKELIAGRTAIIIAHRLSTVRSVDRIAVMENGTLVAIAPHDELLKTNALYRTMVELQQGGVLQE